MYLLCTILFTIKVVTLFTTKVKAKKFHFYKLHVIYLIFNKDTKMSDKKKIPKILGIIPARLKSTRIPEKMLEDICGKTLIERTIERTKKAKLLDALVVATDSERIAKVAREAGVEVIMTDPEIPTGTDRVGEAVRLFTGFQPDIVVNIWGDEPFFSEKAIDDCTGLLLEDPELPVAGVVDWLSDEKMIESPSVVKLVTDKNNKVLNLSRSRIPHHYGLKESPEYYHIIGVMAWKKDFLLSFLNLPRTPLELAEGVEQLRVLEHGYTMRVIKGQFNNLGANLPEELETLRKIYKAREETET